ncbi:hypothetical protein [Dyadobacter flavalbus]|nr:hypothetical protein [Dyadobacter flavalbus]
MKIGQRIQYSRTLYGTIVSFDQQNVVIKLDIGATICTLIGRNLQRV